MTSCASYSARRLDRAVIDEVQRAPDLMLALAESVDTDPRPGRFLLTGSVDLLALPRVAGSLPEPCIRPLARTWLQPSWPADIPSR